MFESFVYIQFCRFFIGQHNFTIFFEQFVQPCLLFVGQTEGEHTPGIGTYGQEIE